jgi:hypothetical protein
MPAVALLDFTTEHIRPEAALGHQIGSIKHNDVIFNQNTMSSHWFPFSKSK